MRVVRRSVKSKRFILALVLMLICAGMLASASARGATTMSDDYGINVNSSAQSQNCPNGSEYDYSTGECVAIQHDDD